MIPLSPTIAAGGFFQHAVAGIHITILSMTSELRCITDRGEETIVRHGITWYPANPFEWIRFENATGAPITVKFVAGKDRLIDNGVQVTIPPIDQAPTSSPWVTKDANSDELRQRDSLAGSSASVTSGAAVQLLAAGTAGKARDVDVRPIGGDIWIADDNGVGAANGKRVFAGEVCTLQGYIGDLYAKAVSATATVYYDYTFRA